MKLQHHKKNGIIMVYGFHHNIPEYDLVMTLDNSKEDVRIYGLLSKGDLSIKDIAYICKYIANLTEPKNVYIEILPHHAKVWKRFMRVIEEKETKTFNGYPSITLKVRRKI